MKNIYLVRHSDAEKASSSKSDFERELTQQGIALIFKAVKGWEKLVTSFDVIVTSPLVRAVQTAEIIAEVFNCKKNIIKDDLLLSGCSPEDFIDAVKSLKGEDIAVVGHVPDLSIIASALISSSGAYVDFKRGMIAKISFEGRINPGRGVLEFLIPPEAF